MVENKKYFFDIHEKSKYWSDKNNLQPFQVALNSHKKFWFRCECGDDFECNLRNVNIGRWCPYCSNKKLCSETENCKICFDKSFVSCEYSKFWSVKNNLRPIDTLKYSHKRYLFNCNCGHEIEKKISDITNNKTWCPYCSSPPKKMCSEKSCTKCKSNSFESVEKSKFWSVKNNISPREVFKNSSVKYFFTCDKCNCDFDMKLCHVTYGSWCPKCRYKTEEKMYENMNKKYPLIQRQYKVDWCKNIKHLPFDFILENEKIIIELDGIAHWKQVAKWKSPEHTRKRDLYKMKCANENNYSVIRILQEDVFYNKYDWLEELIKTIENLSKSNKRQNVFLCKNEEYNDFIESPDQVQEELS